MLAGTAGGLVFAIFYFAMPLVLGRGDPINAAAGLFLATAVGASLGATAGALYAYCAKALGFGFGTDLIVSVAFSGAISAVALQQSLVSSARLADTLLLIWLSVAIAAAVFRTLVRLPIRLAMRDPRLGED